MGQTPPGADNEVRRQDQHPQSVCARTYMSCLGPSRERPAASNTNHMWTHSTQCALRSSGRSAGELPRRSDRRGQLGGSQPGGESRRWLFPARELHLILHSAIRTFIPPSRATLFAFCSEAIQPGHLPACQPSPCPAQCPGAQQPHVHRPGAGPCTMWAVTSTTAHGGHYRRICLARPLLQRACWAAARQSLA